MKALLPHLLLSSLFALATLPTLAAPTTSAQAPAPAQTTATVATLPAAKAVYNVTGIRGHLYYDDTGEIDPVDLVKLEEGALHNTVIGEGIAKRPSNTTLI